MSSEYYKPVSPWLEFLRNTGYVTDSAGADFARDTDEISEVESGSGHVVFFDAADPRRAESVTMPYERVCISGNPFGKHIITFHGIPVGSPVVRVNVDHSYQISIGDAHTFTNWDTVVMRIKKK